MEDSTKRFVVIGLGLAAAAVAGSYLFKHYVSGETSKDTKSELSSRTLSTPAPPKPTK
jgi:hypothetical protein